MCQKGGIVLASGKNRRWLDGLEESDPWHMYQRIVVLALLSLVYNLIHARGRDVMSSWLLGPEHSNLIWAFGRCDLLECVAAPCMLIASNCEPGFSCSDVHALLVAMFTF